jgi:hypothetical protein
MIDTQSESRGFDQVSGQPTQRHQQVMGLLDRREIERNGLPLGVNSPENGVQSFNDVRFYTRPSAKVPEL